MTDATFRDLQRALGDHAGNAPPIRFWLRDDDAVTVTPALERLLVLSQAHQVPMTLAVIPAHSDTLLAERLQRIDGITVAVHGWSHDNHALRPEKKQELGPHRPVETVLQQLARGRADLLLRHGDQLVPVLVPPWNRIAPDVIAGLPGVGFCGLSTFGEERPQPGLVVVNSHVDLIDWRGTRGARPEAHLLADIITRIKERRDIGLLTHHLVHDAAAWTFLAHLFRATATHPAARWVDLPQLLATSG